MADRRRVNGPIGPTSPVVYTSATKLSNPTKGALANKPVRRFLETGVTPSASGSAYLEIEPSDPDTPEQCLQSPPDTIKMTCTVHGPRSLPRSASFSPRLVLTTHVKYAPFASQRRRGYLRDAGERDISLQLETALQGIIIGDRWPKSGVEIVVTILEAGHDDYEGWNSLKILSSAITVAAAALADAGIDCVDISQGGVAALVCQSSPDAPLLSAADRVVAICCVAYLPSRDEVTNVWFKGKPTAGDSTMPMKLMRQAVLSAKANGTPLIMTSGSQ